MNGFKDVNNNLLVHYKDVYIKRTIDESGVTKG